MDAGKLKNLWSDPVLSKILASILYAALVGIAGARAPWYILEHRTIILAACALILAEGFALFISLRTARHIVGPDRSVQRYYSGTTRRWAIGLAFVMPIIVPSTTIGIVYSNCHADQHTVVYVAQFDSRGDHYHYRITRTVFERFQGAHSV